MKKIIIFILVSIILVISFLIFIFKLTNMENKNAQNKIINDSIGSSDYQKVTLADIENNKEKYNGKKVEITGEYEDMFESHNIDGKFWFESSSETIYYPSKTIFDKPDLKNGAFHIKVMVKGTIYTANGHYGNLGKCSFLIQADEVHVLPKNDNTQIR